MTCNVCVESYNNSARKRVTCGECEWSACLACNLRYISSKVLLDPHCMKCKHQWDTEFIVTRLSRKFLKRIEANKKRALVHQESNLLPETQHYLRYDAYIHECVRELHELQTNNVQERTRRRVKPRWLVESDFISKKNRTRVLRSYISAWNNRHAMLDIHHVPPEARTAVPAAAAFACPKMECNGFVMQADGTCGVCFECYCDKCHKTKYHAHVCDPRDAETAKLIMHTSRPCPKCAVRIHKISGCDQMWCTQCNNAFSWKTGKPIEGGAVIHNPHYFEWQARRELPPYARVIARACELKLVGSAHWYLMTMHRLNAHIQGAETRRFAAGTKNNLDLRLQWLKGNITESKLACVLHRRYKKHATNRHRMQVFERFNQESIDLFHRFLHTDEPVVEEFAELVKCTNQRFEHLCRVHHLNMPHIDIIVVDDSGRCVFDIYKHNGFIPMKNYLKSARA